MLASVWADIRQQKGLNSEHQNNQTNQQIEVTYLMAHSGSTFKKDSASLNVEPLSGIHACLNRVQDQTTYQTSFKKSNLEPHIQDEFVVQKLCTFF